MISNYLILISNQVELMLKKFEARHSSSHSSFEFAVELEHTRLDYTVYFKTTKDINSGFEFLLDYLILATM